MPKNSDTKLFRKALKLACLDKESTIFNDKRQGGRRRLKLWFANHVFNAPPEQQWALHGFLREAFGDRMLKADFRLGTNGYGFSDPRSKAFCIYLRD